MQARQIARRKRKELGQEPPRGYVLSDAFRLWCNLKRGRITSYMDEKRRLERYVIPPPSVAVSSTRSPLPSSSRPSGTSKPQAIKPHSNAC